MPTIVAVDLGGTKIACGLVTGSVVSWRQTTPTPATAGAEAILEAIGALIEQARTHKEAVAIGIGSAGAIDENDGRVLAATSHLSGWAGTALAEQLATRTGLPTWALNDVHAHALGEHLFGAARGAASSLLIAAGTGLGGSLIVQGQPLFGAHHRAGHLGHVPCAEATGLLCSCGRSAHLECLASGAGLLVAARAAGATTSTAADLASAAHAGDRSALAWLALSGTALGRAIGGWSNTLDPDVVVLTGGLSQAGHPWWDALTVAARAESLDPGSLRIVPASRGQDAALLGAASYAAARAGLDLTAGAAASTPEGVRL